MKAAAHCVLYMYIVLYLHVHAHFIHTHMYNVLAEQTTADEGSKSSRGAKPKCKLLTSSVHVDVHVPQ